MKQGIKRRDLLVGSSVAAVGALGGIGSLAKGMASRPGVKRKRVLRIAHLTDIHVQPEGVAAEGMARAFRSVQSLADKPNVVFTGGDSIMDALKADKTRVKDQWEVFHKVLKAECSLPVYHCIGNHDVWGWGLDDENIKWDRLYGKQWAVEQFGIPGRYYSFDRSGWHFITLDSTYYVERHSDKDECYTGRLDEEQLEWLSADLQRTSSNVPVCVVSHIPIICFCAFFDGENEKSGDWHVPGAWMHIDARRIKDVFYGHPNVRLCLSGHMHMRDKVEYLGVKYLCDGAVSGAWWDGNHYEFPPGYVVLDLYDDGSSKSEYITYKWK
jgi:3',5'-cyclic AMP phosphodiesterase CpdA